MNRRTSIKALVILLISSLGSWSIWKWFSLSNKPNIKHLHQQRALIDDLTECIIPRTDTPGAKDIKVVDFVIGMIEHCTDRRTQNRFITGMLRLENMSKKIFLKTFQDCTSDEKYRILDGLEKDSKHGYSLIDRVDTKVFGKPFVIKLKELTIEGYHTSKQITTLLDYSTANQELDQCAF